MQPSGEVVLPSSHTDGPNSAPTEAAAIPAAATPGGGTNTATARASIPPALTSQSSSPNAVIDPLSQVRGPCLFPSYAKSGRAGGRSLLRRPHGFPRQISSCASPLAFPRIVSVRLWGPELTLSCVSPPVQHILLRTNTDHSISQRIRNPARPETPIHDTPPQPLSDLTTRHTIAVAELGRDRKYGYPQAGFGLPRHSPPSTIHLPSGWQLTGVLLPQERPLVPQSPQHTQQEERCR